MESVEMNETIMFSGAPGGAREGDVIDRDKWGAIRTMWEAGIPRKAIARQLGLDPKTVRKWIKKGWTPETRTPRGRVLERWREFVEGRGPEVGWNGSVLARELSQLGYSGCYSTVSKYVRPWRETWRETAEPTVRFESGPGEQSQVDWGTTWVWLGEEEVRVHIFTMILGYSRRIFARAYRSEGLGVLLDAHAGAFAHFGGRTETILYDNPRTVVLRKDEASGEVTWNATFKDRMDFYGVTIRLCRYYRAQTKGKVESGVKYVKRNALCGKRFRDLEELNAYLLDWCVNVADQRIHGTTHERPTERFRRETLIPVDARPPAPRETVVTRIVPKDAYVAVEANRYPVPFEWAGREVSVRILPAEVVIGEEPSGLIRHARIDGKHQVARWAGAPRQLPDRDRAPRGGPPQFDLDWLARMGDVDVRPLGQYEAIAEVSQ
jgi:transposase